MYRHELNTLDSSHLYTLHHMYLYTGWSPWDKLGQFSLSDPLETLVHLCGVHFSLDDVEDGDVAVVVVSVLRC